jgi:hypothetical protein
MKYVAGDPPVRADILPDRPDLLAMPFQSLLVVFAEDIWKVGEGGLGVLQAVAGVGGIMAFYVAWAGQTPRKLRLMMSSLFAFAAGTLFLFALSPWFRLRCHLYLSPTSSPACSRPQTARSSRC